MLEEAVKASLWQLAVYDKEELVAYIRLVGDGHSVLLVQDLLVRPDYQRQGIGKKLLEKALETFPHVYQRLLVTERSEKNLAFYQSLGFVELSEQACTGMIYNNWRRESGTKVLASSCFLIDEQDAVVEWALLHWFHQLLQPYSTVRRWDDEIEF